MKRGKIPPYIEIRPSDIPDAGMGAFAKAPLSAGQRLGPYEGRMLTPAEYEALDDRRYVWELRKDDEPVAYVDGRQRRRANWTRYVNSPRTASEENVTATQVGMRMVYFAKRDIAPGEELLVWYGAEYGEWLFGPPKKPEGANDEAAPTSEDSDDADEE